MNTARTIRYALLVALCAIVAWTFSPAFDYSFVWDDEANIVFNFSFRGFSWAHLRWMFTTNHLGHYQPLTWISFATDHAIWGLRPAGYHFTNVVLHLLNALLFAVVANYLLQLAFKQDRQDRSPVLIWGASVAGALLFATHPLRVESVAWVTERRDLLSAACYLVGLWCYIHANTQNRRHSWVLFAAWIAFFASMLAKAWVITLPVVLLLLDHYPLRRFVSNADPTKSRVGAILLEKIPFALIAGAAAAGAYWAQGTSGAMASATQLSVWDRMLQASSALMVYVGKTVWPSSLSPLYLLRPNDLHTVPVALMAAAAIVVTVWAILRIRRHPAIAVAWLAYAAIISPVLGFAQSGQQRAADRYTYLACWPFALLFAASVVWLWQKYSRPHYAKRLAIAITMAVCVTLALLVWRTQQQLPIWHTNETLFSRAIALDPQNYVALNNRGDRRRQAGKTKTALADLSRAIAIAPRYAGAYVNRAAVWLDLSRPDRALADYQRALHVEPKNGRALCGRALIRHRNGDLRGAAHDYDAGLALIFHQAECWSNKGILNQQRGNAASALTSYSTALSIDPNLASAYNNRSSLFLQQGDLLAALRDVNRALALESDNATAFANRARIEQKQGNIHGAIDDLTAALTFDETLVAAYLQRAALYRSLGDNARARSDFKRALQHAPAQWPHRKRVEAMLQH